MGDSGFEMGDSGLEMSDSGFEMSDSRDVPRAVVPRRRWGRRWLMLLAVGLALGGWFGRFAYLRVTLRPTPRPEYWAAQLAALDPPGAGAISAAEARKLLEDYPWCPPASRPAAGLSALDGTYTGPGQLRRGPVGRQRGASSPDLTMILTGNWDESRPDIQAAGQLFSSAAFKERREALRRALEFGWWDGGIDLARGERLRYYEEYKQWARCLAAHSRWIREHEHDAAGMVEDWRMVLQLTRQLQRSNLGTAHMVSSDLRSIVGEEAQYVAREGMWQGEVAALAREADAILRPDELLVGAGEAERIYLRNAMEYCYVREGGDWIDVSECGATLYLGFTISRGEADAAPSRLWNVASPLFHDYKTACSNVDRLPAKVASLVSISACLRVREQRMTLPAERVGLLDGLNGHEAWSIAHSLACCYHSMTQLEAGLTMLALAEFSRKQRRYPERLQELVPGYLPRLPIDYADHGVLRYRRDGSDYVLYGIGANGVDDGGRPPTGQRQDSFCEQGDVVYSPTTRPAGS